MPWKKLRTMNEEVPQYSDMADCRDMRHYGMGANRDLRFFSTYDKQDNERII